MKQGQRFEALDSLRGICACIVALYHFPSTSVLLNSAFIRNSWMFVDFFFVLSGFVIALSYRKKLADGYPIWRFMALRVGRVYPLHFAMLAAFLLFQLAIGVAQHEGLAEIFVGNYTLGGLVASVFMVHIFGLLPNITWNGPSWSIAAEVWAYLLFALLLRGAKGPILPWLLAAAAASALLLALTGDGTLDRTFSFSLVRCCFGFALGAAAFEIHRWWGGRFPAARAGPATIVELAAVLACIAAILILKALATLAVPLVFTLAVLVFAHQAGAISRMLMVRPLLWVGTLSYSIYMVHIFVEGRIRNAVEAAQRLLHVSLFETQDYMGTTLKMIAFPGIWNEVLAIAILVPIIAVAWLTWRFIEEPGRRWSRDRVAGRERKAVAEAEAPVAAL